MTAALNGLGLALAYVGVVWVASLIRSDASLIDRFWGFGFVLLAWFYYWTGPAAASAGDWAAWLVVILVTTWGTRLSLYLTARNWGHGEDYRYREIRARAGAGFWWKSLVTVYLLQGVLLWFISLALYAAIRGSREPIAPLVGIGTILWGVGFYFESAGDAELARFKAKPANRGQVLDTGVWRLTRHPNYFGDACLWWGFYCFAVAAGGWWAVLSPVVMTALLLKVSGVVLLEKKLVATKPQYAEYVRRTSGFIPWWPAPK